MSELATHRLIDASAALGPAERALLNLWIHRGLDDLALGRMTGLSPASLAARRTRIIDDLSEELGLPPAQIQAALEAIAASSAEQHVRHATSNGTAAASPGDEDREPPESPEPSEPSEHAGGAPSNGQVAVAASGAVQITLDGPSAVPAEPAPLPAAAAGPEPGRSSRRRGVWLAAVGVAFLAVAVAVVLVIALSSGPARHRHPPVAAVRTTAVPTPPPSPTSPSPTPTVSRPPVGALASLPGGLSHVSGSILLIGKKIGHMKLRLRVRDLPAPHRGHYELWLYNSILDSRPLARLRRGSHRFTIKLPRDAHTYRWIDISFQPTGVINHSGESILRASDPAAASRRKLKRRSARHRQLRRARSGSNSAKTSK